MLLLSIAAACSAGAAENALDEAAGNSSLSANTSLTREGYFVLDWSLPDDQDDPVLQQATSAGFADVIERSIPVSGSITITGLDDGEYYFRAGSPGRWSSPVQVTVAHHSLGRAFTFFSLGLALFVILVSTILLGNRVKGVETGGI